MLFRSESGVGCNVHYIPVHLHPYYQKRFKIEPDLCPMAEAAHKEILSLPVYPKMSDADVRTVILKVEKAVGRK